MRFRIVTTAIYDMEITDNEHLDPWWVPEDGPVTREYVLRQIAKGTPEEWVRDWSMIDGLDSATNWSVAAVEIDGEVVDLTAHDTAHEDPDAR